MNLRLGRPTTCGLIGNPEEGIDRTSFETQAAARAVIEHHHCRPPELVLGPLFHYDRVEKAEWRTSVTGNTLLFHDDSNGRELSHKSRRKGR